jgi:hypothetical protein
MDEYYSAVRNSFLDSAKLSLGMLWLVEAPIFGICMFKDLNAREDGVCLYVWGFIPVYILIHFLTFILIRARCFTIGTCVMALAMIPALLSKFMPCTEYTYIQDILLENIVISSIAILFVPYHSLVTNVFIHNNQMVERMIEARNSRLDEHVALGVPTTRGVALWRRLRARVVSPGRRNRTVPTMLEVNLEEDVVRGAVGASGASGASGAP